MPGRTVALSIAGSDSSGAAGIQADLKTFHQLGVYGMTAITFVSAQHGAGVEGLDSVDPALVRAQIEAAARNFPIAAAKIGALGDAAILEVVTAALAEQPHGPLVVDPVLRTTNGAPLFHDDPRGALRRRLLPAADLLTPNLPEAATLLGCASDELESRAAREAAAESILAWGPRAVLLKGGHGRSEFCEDLFFNGDQRHWLRARRRETMHTRGTGCTYSAAITAFLARGAPLAEAVERAHAYLQAAIAGAPGACPKPGQRGPLDHWGETR